MLNKNNKICLTLLLKKVTLTYAMSSNGIYVKLTSHKHLVNSA
jgi:hypothetical protein